MDLYSNKYYQEDVEKITKLDLPWELLCNKTVLLSGSTGLIGSFLIDVLLHKNITNNLNCIVFALGRNKTKMENRFNKYIDDPHLVCLNYDVKNKLVMDEIQRVDYALHLASNTHPLLYASDPIGTIETNFVGLQNLLNFAVEHEITRFVFASSNEIYGENRGDVELFGENYCGYINCNTLRAAYTESKRCGEALCQAYIAQKSLDVVIARFTRSYGPTMDMSNTRALSQFIKKAISSEDIVLKSEGNQYFSYTYMADAVSGLLYAMLEGKKGEAYNIADESGDIKLRDLAESIASMQGVKVVYEKPDEVEATGYSLATKARLDGAKIKALGWKPQYDIRSGIERTITILQQIKDC